MQLFFGLAYFVIGLVQLFAIADGIGYAANVGRILSLLGAFFITYIPIIGSVLGVYGAINVWDWSIVQAGLLFFWYVPVFLAITAISAISGNK